MSLNGLTGTFYDYIKANAGIPDYWFNLELHDGIYVGVALCFSGSADYSAAANAFKQKLHQTELVLYWETVKANNLGYKSFLILLQEFLG
jgi:molybdopterin-containing oxidoreductase family iron-sulfur binding subunit